MVRNATAAGSAWRERSGRLSWRSGAIKTVKKTQNGQGKEEEAQNGNNGAQRKICAGLFDRKAACGIFGA